MNLPTQESKLEGRKYNFSNLSLFLSKKWHSTSLCTSHKIEERDEGLGARDIPNRQVEVRGSEEEKMYITKHIYQLLAIDSRGG